MKKTSLVLMFLIVFSLLASSATAILSSSYQLKGTLHTDTHAFFVGKTSITGTFTGYPMETLVNSELVTDMNAFFLNGASSISNLDSVIVAEDIDVTKVDTLEELLLLYYDHITRYSQVDISMDTGLFLLGVTRGTLSFEADLPYAVTSFLPYDIVPGNSAKFFVTGTTVPLAMDVTGELCVLVQLSNSSTIRVKNNNGATLWSGNSANNYIIIQDTRFSAIQQPPVFLFPLNTKKTSKSLTVSVSPADPEDVNIKQLVHNISIQTSQPGQFDTSDVLEQLKGFNDIITATSTVANGALVLLQTNDTVTIDRSSQTFQGFGFARFNTLHLTEKEASTGPTIQADCKLVFLGDHLYYARARNNADGVSFPYEFLFIWVLALCVFLYVRFFLRPDVKEDRDETVKPYALIVHVVLVIIAFILLDAEVSSLFGMSAFTALITQGFSMVTAVFLGLELLLWGLGYVLLAVPLQLLAYSILRLFGIGKGGNGIRKGIGDVSIWIFCGLYLQLMTNIVFLLVQPNSLLPVG